MGSPPPAGSKKEVLKLRSVNNMVIAPAKTGSESKSKIAVRRTAHTNKGMSSIDIPSPFILEIVVIKLALPKILLTPAKCNEKIPKSTAPPACPTVLKGG